MLLKLSSLGTLALAEHHRVISVATRSNTNDMVFASTLI